MSAEQDPLYVDFAQRQYLLWLMINRFMSQITNQNEMSTFLANPAIYVGQFAQQCADPSLDGMALTQEDTVSIASELREELFKMLEAKQAGEEYVNPIEKPLIERKEKQAAKAAERRPRNVVTQRRLVHHKTSRVRSLFSREQY